MSKEQASGHLANELDDDDAAEELSPSLDQWRARIDGLLVHVNLAGFEVRDRVRKNIDLTEDVFAAARSRWSDLHRDIHTDVKAACGETGKLIRDLRQVFEAAEAAFQRGRAE